MRFRSRFFFFFYYKCTIVLASFVENAILPPLNCFSPLSKIYFAWFCRFFYNQVIIELRFLTWLNCKMLIPCILWVDPHRTLIWYIRQKLLSHHLINGCLLSTYYVLHSGLKHNNGQDRHGPGPHGTYR